MHPGGSKRPVTDPGNRQPAMARYLVSPAFASALCLEYFAFVSFTIVNDIVKRSAAVTIRPMNAAFLSSGYRDIVESQVVGGDLPEHCVHAVQMARVGLIEHDEELTAAGVLSGVRHG